MTGIPELADLAPSIPPDTSHLPPMPGQMSGEDLEFARKKIAAGILGILLGGLGVHKFVLGYTREGVIMLLVTLVGFILVIPPIAMGIIGLIEGIMYLCLSDCDFVRTHKGNSRPWF